MGSQLLRLPLTDDDLTGANVIRFNDGAGDVDVTIPLPGSNPYYSFYFGSGYDIGEVVAAALTAASAGSWTASNVFTQSRIHKYTFTRSPTASTTFKWTHANTTFDPSWLGFDGSANDTSATGAFEADWQMARLWRWQFDLHHMSVPERVVRGSRSVSGRREFRFRGGWTDWQIEYQKIEAAAMFKRAASIQAFVDRVPGLSLGDPNFPFEALWEWMGKRAPLHFVRNEVAPTTFESLQLADPEFLVKLAPTKTHRSPALYDLSIPLEEYVP